MASPFDDIAANPIDAFLHWLQAAKDSEPNDPTAAALATASANGMPDVRMVLVKGIDNEGLRFFTNTQSQKGVELQANPRAAMCFHWKSLRRQVRFQGRVDKLGRGETEEYFHSRSRASQIAAAVSYQSHPLASREVLDEAFHKYTTELGEAPVPLPDAWCGFLLVPDVAEFWISGDDRLHDRMQFTREGAAWKSQLLFP